MEGLPRRGEVIFLRFPYTDLSGHTNRPAVTLAALSRNDMLVCQITSRDHSDPNAIALDQAAFAEGGLSRRSFARAGRLFTAHVSIVTRRVGLLHHKITDSIVEKLVTILRQSKE